MQTLLPYIKYLPFIFFKITLVFSVSQVECKQFLNQRFKSNNDLWGLQDYSLIIFQQLNF